MRACRPFGADSQSQAFRDRAMDERYQSGAERIVRDPVIESLARSFDIEAKEVQSLYESILSEMKREATVMDFVPVFVMRKLKDMLLLERAPART